MRVLVIDDSSDCRDLVERILLKQGYRPRLCSSGNDALGVLGQERFDVALVDMGMPGLCGPDLIRMLREVDPEMHIVTVTSFDDRHHVLSALDAGAEGYVLKTELSENLGNALQDVVAGKSPLSGTAASILLRHVRGRIEPPAAPQKRARLADTAGELLSFKTDLDK